MSISIQIPSLIRTYSRFQWASLQIAQLLDLERESDIRKRLGKLPEDLKKAYDEIYGNIRAKPGSALEVADRAFQWVMCSYNPLSTAELVAAVCQNPERDAVEDVDIDVEFILSACNNLLVVDL